MIIFIIHKGLVDTGIQGLKTQDEIIRIIDGCQVHVFLVDVIEICKIWNFRIALSIFTHIFGPLFHITHINECKLLVVHMSPSLPIYL